MSYQLLVGGRPVAQFESASVSSKITGSHKTNDVTLKRGVVLDRTFADWLRGRGIRQHAVLQHVDGLGRATSSYALPNSYIKKFAGPTLNAQGTDIAIEQIDIQHDRVALDPFAKFDTFRKPDTFYKWDTFDKWIKMDTFMKD
jgi:phage tail-like protein